MWAEPLRTAVDDTSEHEFTVRTLDGAGVPVAEVKCGIHRPSRCGIFGEMRALRDDGAPRQRARALVLLVRASLDHAASLGIRKVSTDVPAGPALRDFAAELTGLAGVDRFGGRARRYFGDLADIRSRVLQTHDDDGRVREGGER